MHFSTLLPPARQRAGRQARRRSIPLPASAPAARSSVRDLRGGAPEDRALYRCGCGFQFTAAVTATVGCPHCGTTQAW